MLGLLVKRRSSPSISCLTHIWKTQFASKSLPLLVKALEGSDSDHINFQFLLICF